MNTNALRPGARMFAAIVLGMASPAFSAPIKKSPLDDPSTRSVALTRLLASFDMHATAARRWYVDALQGRPVDNSEFALFSRPLETERIVSFTYRFMRNGKSRVRVYHSRSGDNHPWLQLRVAPGTEYYSAYFPRGATDIVAWNREGSAGLDAERKVARQLERDIRNGLVESGGKLYGYASSEPCDACEAALQTLSDKRGIDITVSYYVAGTAEYIRFHRLRQQYIASIRSVVNGVALNRPYAAGGTAPIFGCGDYSDEGYDE